MFSCEFCEISKNTLSYRTPPVAASEMWCARAGKRKKRAFFVPFILLEGNSFKIFVLPQCILYWIHFQNIHTFTYQKTLLYTLFLFKIVLILQWILKIVNFADDTTIFLRDITYLNRTQVILKLNEDVSSSKNFAKAKPYGLEHIKIELINQEKWNDHDFQFMRSGLSAQLSIWRSRLN